MKSKGGSLEEGQMPEVCTWDGAVILEDEGRSLRCRQPVRREDVIGAKSAPFYLLAYFASNTSRCAAVRRRILSERLLISFGFLLVIHQSSNDGHHRQPKNHRHTKSRRPVESGPGIRGFLLGGVLSVRSDSLLELRRLCDC